MRLAESKTQNTPREGMPPLKTIAITTTIDAAMALALYAYYSAAPPILESSMPSIREAAATALIDRIIALSAIGIVFLAIPCAIYTAFCMIKMPALAKGSIGYFPPTWGLFSTNIRLAAFALVSYGVFEWLGAALKEELIVYVAGVYLTISMIFLYLLACISHSKTNDSSNSPIADSLSDIKPWKAAMPYLAGMIIVVSILTWMAYTLLDPQRDETLAICATLLTAILLSILSNTYQWRLYDQDRHI